MSNNSNFNNTFLSKVMSKITQKPTVTKDSLIKQYTKSDCLPKSRIMQNIMIKTINIYKIK